MIPKEINIQDYSYKEILHILYKNMVYNEFPEKYFYLKKKYGKRFGYPIINLFDCINDSGYTDYILNLPKNGNF